MTGSLRTATGGSRSTNGGWPLSEAEKRHYRREGWLTVVGLLGSDDLAGLRQAIREVAESARSGGRHAGCLELEPSDARRRPAIRRIIDPYARHEAFRRAAHDPRIVDRVESLIGPDIGLQHSKLNWKPARFGSPVEWHQDLAYYPHTNDGVMAVLIYLDDAQKANGCLQVLPRQHHRYLSHNAGGGAFAGRVTEQLDAENDRQGAETDRLGAETDRQGAETDRQGAETDRQGAETDRQGAETDRQGAETDRQGAEVEPRALPAPAGSAIFLHGLTPHSSLPNTSNDDRRTLIFAYRAGDAYPLYYGKTTADDEAVQRQIRGRRHLYARFGGPAPIVPRIDGSSSLYDIQAAEA